MIVLIISITSLVVSVFALYRFASFEAETIVANCDNLDVYDDLEKRIEALEYGVSAHNKNVELLAKNISDLQQETIDIKNKISDLSNDLRNTSTSLNNIIPFVDTTRGMVEDNKRRLDNLNNNE